MSRLLTTIRERLRTASDDSERVLLAMREAVHLARRGDDGPARQIATDLRARVHGVTGLGIAAANVVEGVAALQRGAIELAREKLRRAMAIGAVDRHAFIAPFSAAWLAHIEYNAGRPEQMSVFAQTAIETAHPEHHSTWSRLASAMAAALHLAAEYELSRKWNELARLHSVAEGDELTIEALMHNAACGHVNELRLHELQAHVDESRLQRVEQEISSCKNYYVAIANRSLLWMLHMLEANGHLLQGQFRDAAPLLARFEEQYAGQCPGRLRCLALADYAYCVMRLGDLAEADRATQVVLEQFPADVAEDERAFIFDRFKAIAELEGDAARVRHMSDESRGALIAHKRVQDAFSLALARLPIPERAKIRTPRAG